MQAYVIGSPIKHSLSPIIFRYLRNYFQIDLNYDRKELQRSELATFFQATLKENCIGFNVTLPYKEAVIQLADHVTDNVKKLNSLNVIQIKNGKTIGHNTDVIGIENTLKNLGFAFKGCNVLLWGAGGSAKAVAYVLGKNFISEVYILNRSNRSNDLANSLQAEFPKTKFTVITDVANIDKELHLTINTTPLGMTGKESGLTYFSTLKSINFAKDAIAFDLIYTPLETDFLMTAKSCGLKTVNGLMMLVDQALATFEIWFERRIEKSALRQEIYEVLTGILILKKLGKNIFLTGLMGSGKSITGRILSELLNFSFYDLDALIEEKEKLSVSEIFKTKGEKYFRNLESEIIAHKAHPAKEVIALGGGSLTRENNLTKIKQENLLCYLNVHVNTLLHRLGEDELSKRPLLSSLTTKEREEKLQNLLQERQGHYKKANLNIEIDNQNPTDVAFMIIRQISTIKL